MVSPMQSIRKNRVGLALPDDLLVNSGVVNINSKGLHSTNDFNNIEFKIKIKYECSILNNQYKMIKLLSMREVTCTTYLPIYCTKIYSIVECGVSFYYTCIGASAFLVVHLIKYFKYSVNNMNQYK